MVKYMVLGIACLTLVLSGVTRAVEIKTDEGNCGKNDYQSFKDDKSCSDKGNDGVTLDLGKDVKDECREFDKDSCKDDKGLKDLKDCNYDKDGKGDNKDNKDNCKIEWRHDIDKHDVCPEDKHEDHCDIVLDQGCRDDGGSNSCQPASVPAPASSALGGIGIAGIALMTFARSRRSIA